MLIVSRKTQDHTHHTSAKLALLHSLSSNTLYTRPPPSSHSRIAANFGFYVGAAPFDATTQFSVLSKPASMAPTPQLIWRIPQNMELMDRRRAVWIPLGRHPHRYLGRAIIGGSIHGNGIVLDHRSRLRSDEQELNSPQRLRFCSVLWSWSWLVCSRAPGKRSGDQIWSDLDFGGFFV